MSHKTNKKLRQPLTIITTHFNPDYDAVGSMVAAGKLYPEALLVFPGGADKNLRHFFIASLIHVINPARVNEVDLSKVGRLVVVDTRQPGRLGDVQAVLANPDLDIHIYDHHPDAPGDLQGNFEVVDIVGSTVTILTEIINDCGLELTPEEATMMAVGLYEDTGSFTFNSTTGRDYRAGAALLARGADLNVVSQLTVRELTTDQLALLNNLIDSAETRQARGLSFVIATAQIEHYVEDVAVLAHKMMEIMGLSILFVLVGMDNKVQLIIRSRQGAVNAAVIARKFEGGGHPSAAAASIKNMSLTQAKQKLDEILAETLGSFYTAKNLMVYPPITIEEDRLLEEAREILIKFSINVLVVVDKENQLKGYISEHSVSRAVFHGLLDFPVKAFMNTEFLTVTPEASFNEIKDIIVDRKQRVLPVLEKGQAVGVITRTDLLQVLTGSSLHDGVPANSRTTAGCRNVTSLMREIFSPTLMFFLEQLGKMADEDEIRLYVVGGCVRDLMMRKPCHDVDLTLDGDMDLFVKKATGKKNFTRVIRRHPRFKTATLETEDGFQVDLSTTRREYYEHPGALPVVQTGSLRMDLYRRDFTINSMAVSLNEDNFGDLQDFYRGFQDIKDGYIRVLHNLSFVDDPTRTFRAVRFEARLGFKISKMTSSLLDSAVSNKFITNIDHRRLMQELKLILSEEDPASAIKRLNDFGLLPFIHPSLTLGQHHRDFFTRVRRVRDWLGLTFPDRRDLGWFLYFMALTDRLKPQELGQLADNLTLKKQQIEVLTIERVLADEILSRYKKDLGAFQPSLAYRLFSGLSWAAILFVMAKTTNNELSQAGVAFLTSYRTTKPLSSGEDLIAMGLKKGPNIHKACEILRLARLDGLVKTRAEEVAFVQQQVKKGWTYGSDLPVISVQSCQARKENAKKLAMLDEIH